MHKKLICSMYLRNKVLVAGFTDDTIVSFDPVAKALEYQEAVCDAIVVFDLSDSDESHEEALDMIKAIAASVRVPVYGAGNVKRMEDVKKILYTGCKKAILNYSKDSNVELTKEVSDKFGKDKIIACVGNVNEYTINKELIASYTSEVLLLSGEIIKEPEFENVSNINMTIMLPEVSLDKIIEYYKSEKVAGIVSKTLNENCSSFDAIRELSGDTYKSFSEFKLNSDGLIPVIVQDYKTNEVLMMAYMNEEAYNKTVHTKRMTYWSRSRQKLWLKGEESGHFQYMKSLKFDCDADTLLAKVEQIGAACHTGNYSCFFNDIVEYEYEEKDPFSILKDVYDVISDRKVNPKEGSYTNYLFDKGIDKILKKCGEEATEIVIAAKNPNPNEIKYEISDFLYHVMVLMVEKNVTWEEIMTELANR